MTSSSTILLEHGNLVNKEIYERLFDCTRDGLEDHDLKDLVDSCQRAATHSLPCCNGYLHEIINHCNASKDVHEWHAKNVLQILKQNKIMDKCGHIRQDVKEVIPRSVVNDGSYKCVVFPMIIPKSSPGEFRDLELGGASPQKTRRAIRYRSGEFFR